MRKKPQDLLLWTLVRHSAWTVARKPAFSKAVELQCIYTQKEAEKAVRCGGVIFTDYKAAHNREYAENYPPEVKGLIPNARGNFSRSAISGSQIYIPDPENWGKKAKHE